MDLLSPLRNLRPKSRSLRLVGLDGLAPEVKAALQERANHLRLHGRPHGELSREVGRQVMEQGRAWPKVLEDQRLGTTTVPANFEGLLAIVASWDSILLDEELAVLRNLTEAMVPVGVIYQDAIRKRMAQEEHMREHHSEEWEDAQGWQV